MIANPLHFKLELLYLIHDFDGVATRLLFDGGHVGPSDAKAEVGESVF